MEKERGFNHTTNGKRENLDVTEHRSRALQECDTHSHFILGRFCGVFIAYETRGI